MMIVMVLLLFFAIDVVAVNVIFYCLELLLLLRVHQSFQSDDNCCFFLVDVRDTAAFFNIVLF